MNDATGEAESSADVRLDLRHGTQRTFLHVLINACVVSVMNFTVWFAVTFWVFIQTQSVFATGMISGIFLVSTASTGIWFGSIVDHHHKKRVLQASTLVSVGFYAVALALYLITPDAMFERTASVPLWVFIVLVMMGVIAGNLRGIALPTLVTLLIPADRRDRANGLVGSTQGVSFLVTSVISGLLVAAGGMLYVLLLALVLLAASIFHVARLDIPERHVVSTSESDGDEPAEQPADTGRGVDLRGTIKLVGSVSGLPALIIFSCFNNFLGGAFMALMDAYGLSLMSVAAWGLLWGGLSTAVILGGVIVSKIGLGSNPVKVLLMVNVVLWSVSVLFPLRSSIIVLAVGMFAYMLLVPFAEAAEQTVLQQVVPYERQGRVFGFAQSIEQAASPLTAFLIGPLTQFIVIPFMTDGAGADSIGSWFGTGAARGMALVFCVCGVIGLIATVLALGSKYYRQLSASVRTDTPTAA